MELVDADLHSAWPGLASEPAFTRCATKALTEILALLCAQRTKAEVASAVGVDTTQQHMSG